MSYTFRKNESVQQGLRRIAQKQLQFARDHLAGRTQAAPAEAVHEARKHFKKLRGLLRLVRPALSEKVYQRENAALRDLGRALALARDAQVRLDRCRELLAGADAKTVKAAQAVMKRLEAELGEAPVAPGRGDPHELLGELGRALRRAERWKLSATGYGALGPGLEQVYARGRKALERCRQQPGDEALHDWRKHVKYLMYQLRLLQRIWPEMLRPLEEQLDKLSDLLGEDHDLAVLADWFAGLGDKSKPPASLQARLNARRAELQQQAIRLGRRLFAEKPSRFAGRMGVYFQSWKKDRPAAK